MEESLKISLKKVFSWFAATAKAAAAVINNVDHVIHMISNLICAFPILLTRFGKKRSTIWKQWKITQNITKDQFKNYYKLLRSSTTTHRRRHYHFSPILYEYCNPFMDFCNYRNSANCFLLFFHHLIFFIVAIVIII